MGTSIGDGLKPGSSLLASLFGSRLHGLMGGHDTLEGLPAFRVYRSRSERHPFLI